MKEQLAASHKWIMEHGDQYRGLWLVVNNGELLGAARDLDELHERLGSFAGALVTRMPTGDHWYKGGDMWEHVALTWHTAVDVLDERYLAQYNTLVGAGWEQLRQAPFESGRGGACIMRRPKDEPQRYFHTRHCLCDECAKKRDEPRMWTKGEIRGLMREVNHCLAQPPSAYVGRIWLTGEETNG